MSGKVIVRLESYYISPTEEDSIHIQEICEDDPEIIELAKQKVLAYFRRDDVGGYRPIARFWHEPWSITCTTT